MGKLNPQEVRELLNKSTGFNIAHNLKENNPTEVNYWIPTGSRLLDSIICRGKMAGIPGGKITEIAGLSATGKSYLACQIGANAQKMGLTVVYFDSESALDPKFVENCNIDLDKFIYVQAVHLEGVLENIETLIGTENKFLFILDSYANTSSKAEDEEGSGFNPRADIAEKPRILSKAFSKITIPLANTDSTFLILNQLKTKIPGRSRAEQADAMVNPYYAPGGKTMDYPLSLRIWLTRRRSKSSFIYDDNDFHIGSELKCKIHKSRFGTEQRVCAFNIIWGTDEPRIQDEESWLDALATSEYIKFTTKVTVIDDDGVEFPKFKKTEFRKALEEIPGLRERIYELMEREIIQKFDKREGNASEFYKLNGESE